MSTYSRLRRATPSLLAFFAAFASCFSRFLLSLRWDFTASGLGDHILYCLTDMLVLFIQVADLDMTLVLFGPVFLAYGYHACHQDENRCHDGDSLGQEQAEFINIFQELFPAL